MAAEDLSDIVARVTRDDLHCSTGALAAYLSRSCGHVVVNDRVIQQGYRFHAELGEEIPAFFNRRMKTSTGQTIAVTLISGFDAEAEQQIRGPFSGHDAWSIDPFSECRTTADARAVIESDGYHASIWRASVMLGFELMNIEQVTDPLFLARHPEAFRLIAEELVSLGVVQAHACLLCSDGA